MQNSSTSHAPAGKAAVIKGVVQGLLQGRWKGGERLTEVSAAHLFQVSRTPVREALLDLSALGIVRLRQNCGAIILPFGPVQLSELYAVRSLLETEAARLAAARIPLKLVESMLSGFEVLQREATSDAGWTKDRELHAAIASASGNARLAEEISRYGTLVQTMREAVGETLAHVQTDSVREHLRILRRLRERDAEGAAAAMSAHLKQAERSAIQSLPSKIQNGLPPP